MLARLYLLRVASHLAPAPSSVPSIVSPCTRPEYCLPPALNVMRSATSLPSVIGATTLPLVSVPVKNWYFCCSESWLGPNCQVPSTFAGTIQRWARQYPEQSFVTCEISSAFQSPISKL